MNRPFDLAEEVARQIARNDLLAAGEPLIVAVSGGADSVALLLALRDLGYTPVVAHLDHGLRPESGDDADFVRELAERERLACVVERRDVEVHRRARKLSLEAAAREVRHAFLRQLAERHGARAVFLAHTASDQIETFLLRLIRGAGPAGLGGMRPQDGLLRRPLLEVWRPEVEAYLKGRAQAWREDASNRDRRFLRNRVRHELLPLLASMNPGIHEVLLREAKILAERQADLDAEVLRRLGLNARQIAVARGGATVALKAGWLLHSARAESRPPHRDVELPVPGQAVMAGIGVLTAELVTARAAASAAGLSTADVAASGRGRPLGVMAAKPATSAAATPDFEYVDATLIGSCLRVRTRRRGDRFVPLGMRSPKKLQDFFVDSHVPRERRDLVPLVTDGRDIVWVAGLRLDDRYKITSSTKQAVRLAFTREKRADGEPSV